MILFPSEIAFAIGVMELFAALIAGMITFYSFRAYTLGSKCLSFFSLGFLSLTLALLLGSYTLISTYVGRCGRHVGYLGPKGGFGWSWVQEPSWTWALYLLLFPISYILISLSYMESFKFQALIGFPWKWIPLTEFKFKILADVFSLIPLSYIIWKTSSRKGHLCLPFIAFLLMATSHVLMAASFFLNLFSFYLLAEFARPLAFIPMLIAVERSMKE